jgi:hypothetical protein
MVDSFKGAILQKNGWGSYAGLGRTNYKFYFSVNLKKMALAIHGEFPKLKKY